MLKVREVRLEEPVLYEKEEVVLEHQAQEQYEKIDPTKVKVGNDQKLRVYVDEVNNRYFIDIFAAYSLGMISYSDACKYYDYGQRYYEISIPTLMKLREMFENRIVYIYFKEKLIEDKPQRSELTNPDISYNNFDPDNEFIGDIECNNYKSRYEDEINNYKSDFGDNFNSIK